MEPGAFRTANGVSITSVSGDEMAAVDEIATDELGLSLLQMMENAGRALAEHVLKTTSGPVVVVAGNGGNGGGGLVCARHLRNHHRDVAVRLDRPATSFSGAAAHQYAILGAMGVPTTVGAEVGTNQNAAVVVDALIGYGLTGRVRGAATELVEEINGMNAAIISFDVPSGIDATTGAAPGAVVEPATASAWSDFEIPETYGTLDDESVVIDVERDDAAKAYPRSIVWYQKAVNDALDGPLLVMYCQICRRAMVATR